MKFKCTKCIEEKLSDDPCILILKGAKQIDRDDWKKALRRCPFEDGIDDKLKGVSPVADWVRVRK